jgi:16S rRNA (adenine1518-N6/adenine1519-N6)-dimethyltransferase
MEVRAKKSFGQNFLRDASVVGRIIAAGNIGPTDWVVEVGPGTGVMTEALARKAGRVVAVELDRDLVPGLLKKFPVSGNVSIIQGDVLRVHLTEVLQRLGWDGGAYKVVANIPYYITAPIIQTLLRLSPQPQDIVLMVQREVAERVASRPGDAGLLSVSVRYYADPEMLFVVPKEAFAPVPKVDSAILRITPKKAFDAEEDRRFFRLVRAGFSARRKTLANNLASSLRVSKEEAARKVRTAGLEDSIRAQALDIEDWKRLQSVWE